MTVKRVTMRPGRGRRAIGAAGMSVPVVLALATSSCSGVDYSRDRAIDADIAASLDRGPSSLYPGWNSAQPLNSEPLGAVPWMIDTPHQPER
jgi:hypothetical protein